jgi:hypothetical protein
MDAIWSPDFGENSPVPVGASRGDMSSVPDIYSFDWSYRLKMEMPRSKDNMEIEYRLKENGSYWGAHFDHKDMQKGMHMFMVCDHDIEQTVMFMEGEDMKMATATRLDMSGMDGDNQGLVMEMDFKDKKNKKKQMKMTCIKLEEESYTINKSDYQSY